MKSLSSANKSIVLDASNFLTISPTVLYGVGGAALAHTFYSHIRRANRGLSRRKRRKLSNRKRRRFIDNIIMHHKRLHDKNRASVVENARKRILDRKSALKAKSSLSLQKGGQSLTKDDYDKRKNQNSLSLKERCQKIRGRVDLKQSRVRSRWLTISSSKPTN